MTHVDGNAVLGALSLALGMDASDAEGECARCGHDHHLAQTHVYLRNPGMVMRCPNCGGAELVMVEIQHRLMVTITGLSTIRTGIEV